MSAVIEIHALRFFWKRTKLCSRLLFGAERVLLDALCGHLLIHIVKKRCIYYKMNLLFPGLKKNTKNSLHQSE
jgi:hypothetical protein